MKINFEAWKVIEELLEVLGAMYSITVEVSSKKKITASKIAPLSNSLVLDMLINMEKQFLTRESNATLCRATMLDPRFRDFEKTFQNMNHVETNKIEKFAECKMMMKFAIPSVIKKTENQLDRGL
ncbi:unnamed protein product [Lepeophtheirus salmonis]|uniref:(salmon louse) hypothetical protein n=1 Tax=Lepeophtheirus salmonis TaxID=72036 RepID=A0A7R8CQ72_LEPSM|nr:unnamed protein product [Lepeophtheirus salmonis]CAF2859802.1 unnamed protein product [Lepeophtheirus salmonis]